MEVKKNPVNNTPETNKINSLLKLGLFLILLSGILFATTSWNNISVTFKSFFLVFFGTVFLVLSYFTEKKLKLKTTSFVYSLLSISFYFFTWVYLCCFKVFGDILSFRGLGLNLTLSISCLIINILLLYIYSRFNYKSLLYVIYTFTLRLVILFIKLFFITIHNDFSYNNYYTNIFESCRKAKL